LCFLFMSTCLFVGCDSKNTTPANIIQKEKFIDVLTDIQLAESYEMGNEGKRDSLLVDVRKVYLKIFQDHAISTEQFFITFDYYSRKPEEFKDIYNAVYEQLTLEQEELKTPKE
jgi:uncharacterized protein DUF4296